MDAPATRTSATTGAEPPRRFTGWTIVIGVVVAISVLVWGATGELAFAVAPLAGFAGVALVLTAPPHLRAIGLFFLIILLEDPKAQPAENRWKHVLSPIGMVLMDNLNNVTGVSALSFALLELVVGGFLALAYLRRGAPPLPVPRALKLYVLGHLAAVMWLEFYGLGRGGDFKNSLWQLRYLVWVGPVTLLFFQSIRGRQDHKLLVGALITASFWKTATGFWYYQMVCKPEGHDPAFVTTHSDTILYVTTIMVVLTYVITHMNTKSLLFASWVLPVVLTVVVLNNRRLAFVSLGASLVAVYFVMPVSRFKQQLNRFVGFFVPLFIVYVLVGMNSTSSIFKPAAKIGSLISGKDRSMGTRDIENFNLIETFKPNVLLGNGFGHEYNEVVVADSIKESFAQYRYIAHNSVLWMWELGGLVGFTLLWLPLVVGGYLAVRTFHASRTPHDRAAALTCFSVFIAQEIQYFGDMGTQSWPGVMLYGMSLAVIGKLAVETGAWPGPRAKLPTSARARA